MTYRLRDLWSRGSFARGVVVVAIATGAAAAALNCTSGNPAFTPGVPCASGGTQCAAGLVCDDQRHVCVCPQGSTLCGDQCVDVATSPANCGGCGLSCPAGDTCNAGRCSSGACATGAQECSGQCIDPQTNPQNCGGCGRGPNAAGRRCDAGQICDGGHCVESPCAFGLTECNGHCVDLASSAQNCSQCGSACPSQTVCSEGNCIAQCAPGLTLCGHDCVDLRSDPNNCGQCGETCSKDQLCVRNEGRARCRDFTYAGCSQCPCAFCGERRCCMVADPSGANVALCIEGGCPGTGG